MASNTDIPWNVKRKEGAPYFTEAGFNRWIGEETHEMRLAQNLSRVGIVLSPLHITAEFDSSDNEAEPNTTVEKTKTKQNETKSGSSKKENVKKPAKKIKTVFQTEVTKTAEEEIELAPIAVPKRKQPCVRNRRPKQLANQPEVSDISHVQEIKLEIKQEDTPVIKTPDIIEQSDDPPDISFELPLGEVTDVIDEYQHSDYVKHIKNVIDDTKKIDQASTNFMFSETNFMPTAENKNNPLKQSQTRQTKENKVIENNRSEDVKNPTLPTTQSVAENIETPQEDTRDAISGRPLSTVGKTQSESLSTELESKDKKKYISQYSSTIFNDKDRPDKYIAQIVKKRPRNRKSILSSQEQRRYLELEGKYGVTMATNPQASQTDDEMKEFKELLEEVKKEQKHFQNYLKYTSKFCLNDYVYIHPEANKYVQTKLLNRRHRVLSCPRHYNVVMKFSLVPAPETPPVLQYVRPLLELGGVCKLVMPTFIPGLPQPCTSANYQSISDVCPPIRDSHQGPRVWDRQVVSRDVNAEQLAVPNKCDIVVSASGMKYLVDNQGNRAKFWEMPITVREYDVIEGDKKVTHKVAYIDKPLIRMSEITGRDRNMLFQKYALKSLSMRPKHKPGQVFTQVKPIVQNVVTKPVKEIYREVSEAELKIKEDVGYESKDSESDESDSTDGSGGGKKVKKVKNQGKKKNRKRQRGKKNHADNNMGGKEGKQKAGVGLFDLEKEIDEIETFGMDTDWKAALKTEKAAKKDKVLSPVAITDADIKGDAGKTKRKKSIEDELESLKKELTGIKKLARKEEVVRDLQLGNSVKTNNAENLSSEVQNIQLPGKDKSIEYKQDSLQKGLTDIKKLSQTIQEKDRENPENEKPNEDIEMTENIETNIDNNQVDFDEQTENNSELTNKSDFSSNDSNTNTISNKIQETEQETNSSIPHTNKTKKPMLSVKNVSSLSAKMKQMSTIQTKLRLRTKQLDNTSTSAEISITSPPVFDSITQQTMIHSSLSGVIPQADQKLASVNDNKTVLPALESDDSENESDDGLVIDVPENISLAEMKKLKDNSVAVPSCPASPPASPPMSPPASPPMSPPASPPMSPPASPPMSPPASPVDNIPFLGQCKTIPLDAPLSPQSTSGTTPESLRRKCVVIPLDEHTSTTVVRDYSSVKYEFTSKSVADEMTMECSTLPLEKIMDSSKIPSDVTMDSSASYTKMEQSDVKDSKAWQEGLKLKTMETEKMESENKNVKNLKRRSTENIHDIVGVRKRALRSSTASENGDKDCGTAATEGIGATVDNVGISDGIGTANAADDNTVVIPQTRGRGKKRDTVPERVTRSRSVSVDTHMTTSPSVTRATRNTRRSLESTLAQTATESEEVVPIKRKRGRPKKTTNTTNILGKSRTDEDPAHPLPETEIGEFDKAAGHDPAEDNHVDKSNDKPEKIGNEINNENETSVELENSSIEISNNGISNQHSSELANEDEDNINEVDKIATENKEYDGDTDEEYFESLHRKKGRPITSKATLHKSSVEAKESKKMKEMIAAMKTKNAKSVDKALVQNKVNISDGETDKTHVDEQRTITIAANKISKTVTHNQVAVKTLNITSGSQSVNSVSGISPPDKMSSPSGGNKRPNSVKSIQDKGDNLSVGNILNLQSQLMQPTLPTRSVQDTLTSKHHMQHMVLPVDGNVTYHQWKLADINLIIRSGYHGHTPKQGLVHITPKMEYQPFFGFETETVNETAYNWISVYIRPNSSLIRARINPFNSEVMMMEYVDFPDLIPPWSKFSSAQAFTDLQTIFQDIQNLPVGQYIMKNDPRRKTFTVMSSTNTPDSDSYDLHCEHASFKCKDRGPNPVQWVPIDTRMLLPHHKKMNLVPCLYQPKDIVSGAGQQNKGKKKKKKRNNQKQND